MAVLNIPSFKDIQRQDIKQAYLDPEVFGEEHDVNGKRMAIVLDDYESIEREKRLKSGMDGIFARQVLFYVASDDFGPLPAHGVALRLDNKLYTVMDATDESGIYAVTLEANQSRGYQ